MDTGTVSRRLALVNQHIMNKHKVGIWLRVASIEQKGGNTLLAQERNIINYTKLHGWNVVRTYRLKGLSGRSILGYRETKKMLDDVAKKVINKVVFLNTSCLARNNYEFQVISEMFDVHGAELISVESKNHVLTHNITFVCQRNK